MVLARVSGDSRTGMAGDASAAVEDLDHGTRRVRHERVRHAAQCARAQSGSRCSPSSSSTAPGPSWTSSRLRRSGGKEPIGASDVAADPEPRIHAENPVFVARTASSSIAACHEQAVGERIRRTLADRHPMIAGAPATRARDLGDQGGGGRLHAAPARGDGPLLRTAGTLEDVRRRAGSGCRAARAARVRRGRCGGLPALRDPFAPPDSGQVSGLRVVRPSRVFVSTSTLLSELYRAPHERFPVGRAPVFHTTPGPTDEDVARVAAAVFRRVERRLADRESGAVQRRFVEDARVLVAMAEASVGGVVATGPRRGRRIVRVRGAPADLDAFVMGRLCAEVEGFSLQAATHIHAGDRAGAGRMARYLVRPPIASDRLSRLDDGRLELRLKRPWRDGTTAFVYTPHELLERLVAIVPRPRAHLTRYFGVFAPAFAARAGIVPSTEPAAPKRRLRAGEACVAGGAEGPEDPKSVALGLTDLAGVPQGRSRMRALQGTDGDRPKSVALGLTDLAGVPQGRSRMRALQGTDGDRRGSDVEGGDRAGPRTLWGVGERARVSPRASASPARATARGRSAGCRRSTCLPPKTSGRKHSRIGGISPAMLGIAARGDWFALRAAPSLFSLWKRGRGRVREGGGSYRNT
jgi:hypothetical protein